MENLTLNSAFFTSCVLNLCKLYINSILIKRIYE